jgi:HNH endonuclease
MSYIPADLRRLTIERSGGCCEYCRVHRDDNAVSYHIEHIIALAHGGQTNENNLAFSCSRCNLYKGTNIAAADPDTGEPTFMFHPRRNRWDEHFRLDGATIQPLTSEGRATVFVLHLNDPQRVTQRHLLVELGVYPCQQDE